MEDIDTTKTVKRKANRVHKKISKLAMIKALLDVIADYDDGEEGVKAADKINAIKQICAMQGYHKPTVSKIIQEIEIEF